MFCFVLRCIWSFHCIVFFFLLNVTFLCFKLVAFCEDWFCCYCMFVCFSFIFFFVWFDLWVVCMVPRTHIHTYQKHTHGFFCSFSETDYHTLNCHTKPKKKKPNRNINNVDTSVPSIHSSGCDSGVGLTTQLNDGASKHIMHLMRESRRRIGCDDLINNKRGERCVCGFGAAGPHICSGAEDSR